VPAAPLLSRRCQKAEAPPGIAPNRSRSCGIKASTVPLLTVLDDTDTDQLLEKLRLVHGEPRFDIAPELTRRPARNGVLAGSR
jgi:hypothetical protein